VARDGATVSGEFRLGEEPAAASGAAVDAVDPGAGRAAGENFPVALRVLPAGRRRYLMAVYGFARTADDIGDQAAPDQRLRLLDELEADLRRLYAGRDGARDPGQGGDGAEPRSRVVSALGPAVTDCGIPMRPFLDLIQANRQDQAVSRYPTFEDLLQYCRRVASAVGLICLHIFGCRSDRARDYAQNLGVALQLTNILRDVKSDLLRGRLYLPLEDLAAEGCTVSDLDAGRPTAAVRRLLAFECGRAREFYRRALASRPDEERSRLVAAEIMRAVYFETLMRIERSGYDVFSARVRVPKPKQALIALREWLFPA